MNHYCDQVGLLPTRNNEERPYGHERPVSTQPQLSSSYQYPGVYNFTSSNGLPTLPNMQQTLEIFQQCTSQFQHQQQSLPLTLPPTEKNEKGLRRGKWTVSHKNFCFSSLFVSV